MSHEKVLEVKQGGGKNHTSQGDLSAFLAGSEVGRGKAKTLGPPAGAEGPRVASRTVGSSGCLVCVWGGGGERVKEEKMGRERNTPVGV